MCQGGTQLRLQPAFLEWESKPRYILLCWQTLWSPAKSETQSKDAQFEFLLNTRKEENVVVTVFLLPSFYIPPNSAHCSGGCFSIREEVCLLTGTLSAAKGEGKTESEACALDWRRYETACPLWPVANSFVRALLAWFTCAQTAAWPMMLWPLGKADQ